MAYAPNGNPWLNSGYDVPKYVEAEPPERGVYTTDWLPRGTISQVIPDYLAVAQRKGSTLAKTSLSGTCFDEHTLSGHSLGDDTLGNRGNGRGRAAANPARAARALLARAKSGAQLKQALGAIHRELPARAAQHANAARARGVPAKQALARGITKALSEIGSRSPQAQPLRGLGRTYIGLGADIGVTSKIGALNTAQMLAQVATPVMPAQPAPGECRLGPDGTPQFIWTVNPTGTGYWSRLAAGQTCKTVGTGPAPTVRDHTGTAETNPNYVTQGGVSVTPTKVMQVGAFTIPVVRSGGSYKWGLDSYAKLTAEQAAQIKKQLQKGVQGGNSLRPIVPGGIAFDSPNTNGVRPTMQSGKPTGSAVHTVWGPGDWLTTGGWLGTFGFKDGEPYDWRYTQTPNFDRTKGVPIAQFNHPDTGAHYGMWMDIAPVGPELKPLSAGVIDLATGAEKPWPEYTQRSQMLRFMVAPMPDKSWLGDLWDWIKGGVAWVVTKFYEGVWDVAEVTSDVLCAMATTPGGLQKAAAAGGPYGVAGATAAQLILAGKCPVPNPTPEGLPGPTSENTWLVPVAIGVGGLLLYALTR